MFLKAQGPHPPLNRATGSWVHQSLEIDFNELDPDLRSQIKGILCIEMGKDVEHWGGHFGSQ